MKSSILYYILSCSVILYYGFGINRLLTIKKDYKTYIKSFVKALLITASTTALSWCLIRFVLSVLDIIEFYPVLTSLFFIVISIAVHAFIKTAPIDITEDYAVPFIIILISLNEGAGIVSSLVISLSCIFSFYLLGVIIFALRRRFRLFGQEQGFKSITYLLISIAIIFIALFSWNASWFTIGLNQ